MKKELEWKKTVIGSCNCSTKTPEIDFHDELCYYRLLIEKSQQKEFEKELEEANDLFSEMKDDNLFLEFDYVEDDDFFTEPYRTYDGDHSYNDIIEEENGPPFFRTKTIGIILIMLSVIGLLIWRCW